MEKIVNKLINHIIKGADTYVHEGSTWLIFTDTKKWAIELTKDRTLWYNYNLFKNVFGYASMDVVENQHYITKWVEDNIIGVNKTNSWNESLKRSLDDFDYITKVIQEGVKHTDWRPFLFNDIIENTIQNGIKETKYNQSYQEPKFQDALKNGINRTKEMDEWVNTPRIVGEVIDNGIKETKTPGEDGDIVGAVNWMEGKNIKYVPDMIDDVIENGVKNIRGIENDRSFFIEDTLKMGVKETKTPGEDGDIVGALNWVRGKNIKYVPDMIDDVIENGVKETNSRNLDQFGIGYGLWKTQTVIENGIKEVQPLPSQEGNKDWGIYYHRKQNRTKPHTEYVDEVINEGTKNK